MDAQTMADSLQRMLSDALRDRGHGACRWSDQAIYDPAGGQAVCGCGVAVPFELPSNGGAAKALERLQEQHPESSPPAPMATSTPGVLPAVDPIRTTLALIDPTQHYSPVDLEKRLLDVLARMETGQQVERAACDEYFRCKAVFERAFNVAVLASEATAADKRKADAMVKCEKLHQDLLQAEWAYKALKETMHNLRGVLSGYQSVARSVGLDYQAGGANK